MPINFSSKKTFIRKIKIEENDSYFYLLGTYNIGKKMSFLRIKKLKFNRTNYKENYECKLKDILEEFNNDIKIDKKNTKDISLNTVKEINCLFGFIKFNMGYYAIFSCDSEIVGKIARNIIFRVDRLIYFPLFEFDEEFRLSREYIQETKYINLVNTITYDKQLYFSYSYDLSKTLQRNFVESFKNEMVYDFVSNAYISNKDSNKNLNEGKKKKSFTSFNENESQKNNEKSKKVKLSMKKYTNYYFCWNYFHMKEFFDIIKNKSWINYCIYGYFGQVVCNIKSLRLQISVIARRNRHYAGMRYLKRGICEDGNVANDVETEQILEEINTTWSDRPKISSYIQIRGSIPIYWFQKQISPIKKPIIEVNLSDIRFEATKRHFASLLERYGHPCIAINLTKIIEDGKPQETLLNEWYYNSIKYINNTIDDEENKIIYYHYDFKSERSNKTKFYKQFYNKSCDYIDITNLFSFMPIIKNKYHISLQNGVVRTNCIDCLDRTNVFQQILGIAVLVLQFKHLGVNENFPENKNDNIYGILAELYIKMGHELSNQYTGSLALKQTITDDNRNLYEKMINSVNEIIIACKRNVMNYFNDQPKQNAMNLFLGKYPINTGFPLIWEMPNDEILHKKKNLKKLSKDWYKDNYNKYIIYNLFSDIDKKKNLRNNDKVVSIYKCEEIHPKGNLVKSSKNQSKEIIKMSTTSLFIHNDLCSRNSNDSIIHRKSSHKIIRISDKFSLDEDFNPLNKLTSINEYIFDYNSYIETKSKNQSKEDEEKAFEDDSTFYYLLEVKNQDVRDLNNFEYYNANFIKKNGLNNNAGETTNQNSSRNINQFHKSITQSNFEEFNIIKNNIYGVRKSSKYKTPIKKNLSKYNKASLYSNETRRPTIINDRHGSLYIHYINYTPYTPYITNRTSKFSPCNIPIIPINHCTNPRNVDELKKEMLKINSSFQINDNDFNKINNFTQPIEKQLKRKDIYELEPFNTCDLENTEGIYETHKHIEKEILDFDPFQTLVSEEIKKEEIDNEVDDYIIFDVKNNLLYKKSHDIQQKKTNLMPIKDFFPDIRYGNKDGSKSEENKDEEEKLNVGNEGINKDSKNKNEYVSEDENLLLYSPKLKITRAKKFPLKIEDDYYILK